ncbi:MAG: putative oxygen-independent coproporphyrinogen III oxidase [Idiomarinaceae bacterium HL-53]|nr:MAG: putative oxygen-independent coproporphyrinogen III oxidase [Idiomarinaceae bacterium HL-53]CUS48486.1 coproporphyrinogen III oxidase, anaerobic [Idiomarinaceae bacterium HL-53]
MSLQLPTLSLYVHIPWCVQKCPYCDFNSHAQPQEIPESAYIQCLLDDLRQDLPYAQGRSLSSIFIGGGTPSLFTAEGIDKLLRGIEAMIPFEDHIEITLEANPGTFETERFSGFKQAGVNRLSIGVQSLQEAHLIKLGRIHNPEQALRAAQHAQQLALSSFNLDLMHGLPNQSTAEALSDLEAIIACNPPHISWYQLTIEPNTLFASQPPILPDDDTLWNIYQQGHDMLTSAGYMQYEVSAYSKLGHRSKHNINYWEFGDYLGIGCGAHGKITLPSKRQIIRTEKVKHPRGYMDLTRDYLYRSWNIEEQDLVFEYFMNHFRLMTEAPRAAFEARTGLQAAVADTLLQDAIAENLISRTETGWQPTALGRLHLNKVLSDLLPE